jgi:glycosyltransferase involved in cell wall biosynthesis
MESAPHTLNTVSIVVSMYNEEGSIAHFWDALRPVLSNLEGVNSQIIWVNDGSTDETQQKVDTIISADSSGSLNHLSIEFSRNYGHEAAMIAGIDVAENDAIICLDCDLQHPPDKIPELLQQFKEGNDIVLTTRKKRKDGSSAKKAGSRLFYKFLNSISAFNFNENSSDFFLISKRVGELLQTNFRERNRFIRGYIQIIGFPRTTIEYDAPAREHGKSNYSSKSLIKLGFNAIFTFSNRPLQVSAIISLIFILFTFGIAIYSLCVYFFGETPPTGYTTIIIFNSLCFSILFFLIAILSIYFGKSLDETRQRPIYIIKNLKKSDS